MIGASHALNPYALANLVIGERRDWSVFPAGLPRLRALARAIYGVDDVGWLYPPDPRDSLLTAFVDVEPGFLFDTPGKALARLSQRTRAFCDLRPDLKERVLPSLAPVAGLSRTVTEAATPPAPERNGISFVDPDQGLGNTCSVIAMLISLAFCARDYLKARVDQGIDQQQQRVRWGFRKGSGAQWLSVETSTSVITKNGEVAVCRSTEPGEVWPGLLEKAFVVAFRRLSPQREPLDSDYAGFNSAVPAGLGMNNTLCQAVLESMFGSESSRWLRDDEGIRLDNDFLQLFDSATGRAKCVVIADTKQYDPSSDEVLGDAQLASLFPRHAYAVLGKVGDCLVLKDPYGDGKNIFETLTPQQVQVAETASLPLLSGAAPGTRVIDLDKFKAWFFGAYAITPPPPP